MNRRRQELGPEYIEPGTILLDPTKDVVLLRLNNAHAPEIVEEYKADFVKGKFGEPPQVILVKRITPALLKELSVPGLVAFGRRYVYVANDGHHRIRAAFELGIPIKTRILRVVE